MAKKCIEKCKKSKLFHIAVKDSDDQKQLYEQLKKLSYDQLQKIIDHKPIKLYAKKDVKAAITFINEFTEQQKYSLIDAIEFDNADKREKLIKSSMSG